MGLRADKGVSYSGEGVGEGGESWKGSKQAVKGLSLRQGQ